MNARLYLYSDLRGTHAWAATLDAFRRATGATWGVRACAGEIEPPSGYVKTGRGLADDPAVPLPTMRAFVHALAP